MSWNQWMTGWLARLTSGSRRAIADQAAARCEERAWTLVERRIMWLSPHELRGYVRARARGLIEAALLDLPESFVLLRRNAAFRATVTDCLLSRLRSRATMIQMELGYRHAA